MRKTRVTTKSGGTRVVELDDTLEPQIGVRRFMQKDGSGRADWYWVANIMIEAKQNARRWSVSAHGDKGAYELAIAQKKEWTLKKEVATAAALKKKLEEKAKKEKAAAKKAPKKTAKKASKKVAKKVAKKAAKKAAKKVVKKAAKKSAKKIAKKTTKEAAKKAAKKVAKKAPKKTAKSNGRAK